MRRPNSAPAALKMVVAKRGMNILSQRGNFKKKSGRCYEYLIKNDLESGSGRTDKIQKGASN
jgi:hypothetical protein